MRFFLFFIFLCLSENLFTQNILDGIYLENHFVNRQKIECPYLVAPIVQWTKEVKRRINLCEKTNRFLSYSSAWQMSLWEIVKYHLLNEPSRLTAYLSLEVLKTNREIFNYPVCFNDSISNPNQFLFSNQEGNILKWYNNDDIFAWDIKEEWFFDRERSVMDVKIIAIAPVAKIREQDTVTGEWKNSEKKLFWLYFPQLNGIIKNYEEVNRPSDCQRHTFADSFHKRKFASEVYYESSIYDPHTDDILKMLDVQLKSSIHKVKLLETEREFWEF